MVGVNKHETAGMTTEEKIARCRQWVPGGKFIGEIGSVFKPSPIFKLKTLNSRRDERHSLYP